MIKSRNEMDGLLHIDLTGPDGNAFVLLGHMKTLTKQLHLDGDAIQAEAMSGDYDHLVDTMEKYFSEHVVLYR